MQVTHLIMQFHPFPRFAGHFCSTPWLHVSVITRLHGDPTGPVSPKPMQASSLAINILYWWHNNESVYSAMAATFFAYQQLQYRQRGSLQLPGVLSQNLLSPGAG